MSDAPTLLRITNLKQYFPLPKTSLFQRERLYSKANDGVSLEIKSGETFALVGESGSGKSTFGRTLLQLYRPTDGETLYFGKNVWNFRPSYAKEILKNAEKYKKGYDKRKTELSAQRILGGLLALPLPELKKGRDLLLKKWQGEEVEEALFELKKAYQGETNFEGLEENRSDAVDLSKLTQKELSRLRSDLQIIFQDPYSSLNPRMTVEEIISEGVITHCSLKKGSEEMRRYLLGIIKDCGLQEYMLGRYPHQFSGGQRQRICIARSLAVKPKFIVCDECVSALDLSVQAQILNLLTDLKKKENLTFLFISHDLSVVRYLSDRIAVMYLGKIVETGETEEIFKNPRHPYTIALLSAIPSLEEKKSKKILLEGNSPSNVHSPKGCPFHTRCFMAQERCKHVPAPVVEVGKGHTVACHFAFVATKEKRKIAFGEVKEKS